MASGSIWSSAGSWLKAVSTVRATTKGYTEARSRGISPVGAVVDAGVMGASQFVSNFLSAPWQIAAKIMSTSNSIAPHITPGVARVAAEAQRFNPGDVAGRTATLGVDVVDAGLRSLFTWSRDPISQMKEGMMTNAYGPNVTTIAQGVEAAVNPRVYDQRVDDGQLGALSQAADKLADRVAQAKNRAAESAELNREQSQQQTQGGRATDTGARKGGAAADGPQTGSRGAARTETPGGEAPGRGGGRASGGDGNAAPPVTRPGPVQEQDAGEGNRGRGGEGAKKGGAGDSDDPPDMRKRDDKDEDDGSESRGAGAKNSGPSRDDGASRDGSRQAPGEAPPGEVSAGSDPSNWTVSAFSDPSTGEGYHAISDGIGLTIEPDQPADGNGPTWSKVTDPNSGESFDVRQQGNDSTFIRTDDVQPLGPGEGPGAPQTESAPTSDDSDNEPGSATSDPPATTEASTPTSDATSQGAGQPSDPAAATTDASNPTTDPSGTTTDSRAIGDPGVGGSATSEPPPPTEAPPPSDPVPPPM